VGQVSVVGVPQLVGEVRQAEVRLLAQSPGTVLQAAPADEHARRQPDMRG
jgi:acyl CoA:acetate/3-ketoacid CoA transferase beta subunit